MMSRIEPKDPDFRAAATAIFAAQPAMRTLGISLLRLEPGKTLTVREARAFAERDGAESLVATMTGTLMALMPRERAPL